MEKETVTGTVNDIIYYNADNGYTVLDVDLSGADLITAVGFTADIAEGQCVALTGSWTNHAEYGEQFKFDSYEIVMPSEEQDILRYLSSGVVYGVRGATAKKLVAEFGKDTLKIMLTNPEKMAQIKGISKNKAMKIGESFREIREMQTIVMYLQQYGINVNAAIKVYRQWGDRAVKTIKENPYILADNIDGITFAQSDKIAYGEGIAANSPMRIKSGIKHILTMAAYTSGHTYLPRQLLSEDASYKLKVESEDVDSVLAELIMSKDVQSDFIGGEPVYCLTQLYRAESYIASRLCLLASADDKALLGEQEAQKRIDSFEKITGYSIAPQQRAAVICALERQCMVLTGGPGTGKTTTINIIIKLLEEFDLKIVLAAPTGRAAKRMTQLSGMEAKTIHRLLGATGEDGTCKFTHNEENPISADVVILDEVSMLDVNLMYAFLKALKPGSRLIMSGDADQLPSVGPGNVLNDIIRSGIVPVIKLDTIFRQAEESLIVVNAHRINAGEMPELSSKTGDFFFMKRNTASSIVSTISSLCSQRLPGAYGIDPLTDIQVISPSKKGVCGSINLNHVLQNVLNPDDGLKNEYSYGKILFREGDKVMQKKNNYDIYYTRSVGESGTGIFNGDMGRIDEISVVDKLMVITFDEEKRVEYPFTQLDELDLAYAVTVHKSQGSEFPYVIMPAAQFPPLLMCRNLLYTAVTRARNMVILVGAQESVEYMTKNGSEKERYTGLCEKLVKQGENELESFN